MRQAAQTRPEPSATGTLESRPVVHLLVYARELELSGTLELTDASGRALGLIVLQKGRVFKARVDQSAAYFGTVAYELGIIDRAKLDKSLAELAKGGKRHGDVLVAQGAMTRPQVDIVLAEQVFRKVAYLHALPQWTRFAFYHGYDGLKGWPSDGPKVDPLPGVWRGVRDCAPEAHVKTVLDRLGTARWRLRNGSPIMSFAFDSAAVALLERLRAPTRIPEFVTRSGASRELAQRLAYVLAITKCIEPGDAHGVPPPSRPPVHSSGTYSRHISFEMRTPYARASAPPGSPSSNPIPTAPPAARISEPDAGERVSAPPQAPSSGRVPSAAPAPPISTKPPTVTMPTPLSPISHRPPASVAPPVSQRPAPISQSPPVSQQPTPISQKPAPVSISSPPISQKPTPVSVSSPPISQKPAPISAPPGSRRPPTISNAPIAPRVSSSSLPARSSIAPPTRAEIALRASKLGTASFYEILGVPPNAALEDIQGAYLRLSATWRADRLPAELDDVRELCGNVQAQIDAAYKTLSDPAARSRYDVTGGKARPSAPVDAAKVYREAEAALENGQLKLAEELCKRAYELAPDVGRYAAMLVWIDAQRAVDAPPEHTKPLILKLDRIIGDDPHCEEALFYRATLLKRVGNDEAAIRDFARVVALNPKNIDAAREVRLAEMRKKKR